MDLFNLLNATGITTLNNTFGAQWQRPILLAASQLPRSAPWRSIASIAYSEQLGMNRQLRPSRGRNKYW